MSQLYRIRLKGSTVFLSHGSPPNMKYFVLGLTVARHLHGSECQVLITWQCLFLATFLARYIWAVTDY